jgi:hypothetical protein
MLYDAETSGCVKKPPIGEVSEAEVLVVGGPLFLVLLLTWL